MSELHIERARMAFRVLPHVAAEPSFALKGGTAINLFYQDLARLSDDIDLTWLPIANRDQSLHEISDSLDRIVSGIRNQNSGINAKRSTPKTRDARIYITEGNLQIKLEASLITRGSVLEPTLKRTTPRAEHEFGCLEMRVLAFEDTYAGKLVATLDRRHPRDLFDVKVLYENQGISDDLLRVFCIYLASSNRPIHELLAPKSGFLDFKYHQELRGTTLTAVSQEMLIETGQRLLADIRSRLSNECRSFLLSLHDLVPDFEVIGLPDSERLPAIQWKLLNLKRLKSQNPEKHAVQRSQLLAALDMD